MQVHEFTVLPPCEELIALPVATKACVRFATHYFDDNCASGKF